MYGSLCNQSLHPETPSYVSHIINPILLTDKVNDLDSYDATSAYTSQTPSYRVGSTPDGVQSKHKVCKEFSIHDVRMCFAAVKC